VAASFDLPYFPRHGLVEEVFQILTSGLKQGVTLFAPRRQGKTSAIHRFIAPNPSKRSVHRPKFKPH
jgi:AAA+ ATPase superfamily predicted ATPase